MQNEEAIEPVEKEEEVTINEESPPENEEIPSEIEPTVDNNIIEINQEQYGDIIENQELLLNEIQELNKVETNGFKALIDTIQGQEDKDYTAVLGQMVESQNSFTETINGFSNTFALVDTASSSVITYAVVFVPLILIVTMLWWFFRQFLRG